MPASNSLTANNPAETYLQLLHIGTGVVASGCTVRTGNGTATPLSFTSSGGVASAAGLEAATTIKFNGMTHTREGTAARTITWKDWSGTPSVVLNAVKAADQTNSTVTPAAVSAFSITLEANAVYEFEAVLLATAAATTTGVQIQLTGPTEIDWVCYDVIYPTGTTLSTSGRSAQYFTAFGQVVAATTSPAADPNQFPIFVKGLLKTSGSTPTADLGFSFNAEVVSGTTIKAGSMLRVRRIL